MINYKDLVLGIDLGTTNSCCAIMLNNKLEVIFDVDSQKKIIPSVVCYKSENNTLIGENALDNLKEFIYSTIFESKRLLGHLFSDPEIKSDIDKSNVEIIENKETKKPQYILKIDDKEIKRIYPEDVSREMLKYFKANAEKFVKLKTKKSGTIEKAVITIPYHFNPNRIKITKKIGEEVFKGGVDILKEPIAIGLGYGFIHPCKQQKTFLLFDIGGGSFGISIFKILEKQFTILAVGGGGHLGGEDFNKALIDYVQNEISKDKIFKDKIKFNNKDKKTLRILFGIKKKVNKVLSQLISDKSTNFKYEDLIEDKDFTLKITKEFYVENLCKNLWQKIFNEIDNLFQQNKNIKKENIDEIILVGGSSRTPGIKDKIKEYFKKDMILQDVNVDEIVAQGAAVFKKKDLDIIPKDKLI